MLVVRFVFGWTSGDRSRAKWESRVLNELARRCQNRVHIPERHCPPMSGTRSFSCLGCFRRVSNSRPHWTSAS
jgi:hypothetical protein